jgi:hypothetical protein
MCSILYHILVMDDGVYNKVFLKFYNFINLHQLNYLFNQFYLL